MALSSSGKKVSERHEIASQTKKTAGQAATILKKNGITVTAKSLIENYALFYKSYPEWHHSGFYKKGSKSTMGKTYFFTQKEIDQFEKDWTKIQTLIEEKRKEAEIQRKTKIKGFYYYWDYDYNGRYGKKQNFKVLGIYEGSELGKPKNFTQIKNKKQFDIVKSWNGKKYYGWDEPSLSDFKDAKVNPYAK